MKTFKQFQESIDLKIDYSFILNNCSDWMTEVMETPPKSADEIENFLNTEIYNFYIGIYETRSSLVANVKEKIKLQGNLTLFSRQEQATLIALHETFQRLGFTATPLNSFVCNTSKEDATLIGGKPYLVFPLNGYKYTYSPFVYNMTFFVKKLLSDAKYSEQDWIELDEKKFQEKFQYRDFGLGKYVKLRKEIQVFLHGSVYLVKVIK